MKRLISLILIMVSVLTLAGCNEALEHANKNYYVVGSAASYESILSNDEYKMSSIALNDERIKSIKKSLNKATAIYIKEIVLSSDLTIAVLRTDTEDVETVDFCIQDRLSGEAVNLTIDTLTIPEYSVIPSEGGIEYSAERASAKEAGTYYIVYAELANSRALGLIKK